MFDLFCQRKKHRRKWFPTKAWDGGQVSLLAGRHRAHAADGDLILAAGGQLLGGTTLGTQNNRVLTYYFQIYGMNKISEIQIIILNMSVLGMILMTLFFLW